MIRYIVLLVLLLLPTLTPAQSADNYKVDIDYDSGNLKVGTGQDLHLVTPILLRSSTGAQNHFNSENSSFKKPGFLFVSSLVLPGSGQIVNGNPIRAGIYAALEIASIYMMVEYQKRGQRGERNYRSFADNNWSVVQYATWLIEYHDFHNIPNPYLSQLRSMLKGIESSFDTSIEWNQIDLMLLRSVERRTLYMTTDDLGANNFSHVLPAYGSQQYYELISKYYQYQAGWRDYHSFHDLLGHTGNQFSERYFVDRNGLYASPLFYQGVQMSRNFNDDFRTRRAFLSLLIVNHFISAFDAYFTISLKQNRLNVASTAIPGEQLIFTYRF